jgi:hypothetical protein
LKELIPTFVTGGNIEITEVTHATKETLCVKNKTIELLDVGNDNSNSLDDDDDDVMNDNIEPASK